MFKIVRRGVDMEQAKNIWLDGIMGVITGDALGCPVRRRH